MASGLTLHRGVDYQDAVLHFLRAVDPSWTAEALHISEETPPRLVEVGDRVLCRVGEGTFFDAEMRADNSGLPEGRRYAWHLWLSL